MKIFIFGISGRMGQRLFSLAKEENIEITGGYSTKEKNLQEIEKADVLVDFSNRELLPLVIEIATKHQKPLVIGTTGYNENDKKLIKKSSKEIPIFFSSNFSLGIAIVKDAVKEISKKFKEAYIDVLDIHHIDKKDSPSGTALILMDEMKKHAKNEIQCSSVRSANVIGEHIITFRTNEETIEIKHSAKSRDVFVKGALEAVKFIKGKEPKLYEINDMLNKR